VTSESKMRLDKTVEEGEIEMSALTSGMLPSKTDVTLAKFRGKNEKIKIKSFESSDLFFHSNAIHRAWKKIGRTKEKKDL